MILLIFLPFLAPPTLAQEAEQTPAVNRSSVGDGAVGDRVEPADGGGLHDERFSEEPTNVLRRRDEPFSLDLQTAIQAVRFIRRAGVLQTYEPGSRPELLPVESVWLVLVVPDTDPDNPPLDSRYDLVLNGAPLAWERTYMLYGGRMVNLGALFTYRNERPAAPGPYTIPAH